MVYKPHNYQSYCVQRIVSDPYLGLFLQNDHNADRHKPPAVLLLANNVRVGYRAEKGRRGDVEQRGAEVGSLEGLENRRGSRQ